MSLVRNLEPNKTAIIWSNGLSPSLPSFMSVTAPDFITASHFIKDCYDKKPYNVLNANCTMHVEPCHHVYLEVESYFSYHGQFNVKVPKRVYCFQITFTKN